MCTRYYMDDAPSELSDIIEAVMRTSLADKFVSNCGKPIITSGEVRPTDIVPILAPNRNGIRTIFPMRWGFKNPDHDSTIFNARVESAGKKPTFKDAWKSHRCIVPASYYFEWEHIKGSNGKIKTSDKYIIQPTGATVTWMCGLYRIENGYPVFVVLTREPSDSVSFIHDRMPLILPSDKINAWINPETDPSTMLQYAINDMVTEKVIEDKPDKKQIPNQMTIKYVT